MKGILFNHPYHMWHAVLAGNKTQTRREGSLKAINEDASDWRSPIGMHLKNNKYVFDFRHKSGMFWKTVKPHYQPGEIVYLKEPVIAGKDLPLFEDYPIYIYKYEPIIDNRIQKDMRRLAILDNTKWRNKLFMPKEAARHYVKITSVRVERLKNMSNPDVLKEGLGFLVMNGWYYIKDNVKIFFSSPKSAYLDLFKKVGKKMPTKNPWLFVYDFVLCDKNGNSIKN